MKMLEEFTLESRQGFPQSWGLTEASDLPMTPLLPRKALIPLTRDLVLGHREVGARRGDPSSWNSAAAKGPRRCPSWLGKNQRLEL